MSNFKPLLLSSLTPGVTVDTIGGTRTATIVGIVEDQYVLHTDRNGVRKAAEPLLYLSANQAISTRVTLLLASDRPHIVANSAASLMHEMNPDMPVENMATLWDRLNLGAGERVFSLLFGIIGATAFGLAVIGLYGIVSYAAEQRKREFGVRMALGATPTAIGSAVVRDATAVVLPGLLFGLLFAHGTARVLTTLLYDVHSTSLGSYMLVLVTFCVVTLLAALIPARRAMRVQPIESLHL